MTELMKKLAVIGSGRMAWIIGNHAHDLGIETHCFSNVEPDFIHEAFDVFHNISIFEKDKIVDYTRDELKTVLLGYSMSVHRVQGSEYDYAIVVIDNTHFTLLDRCLLYTAITRAKKMCILVAQPTAFKMAIKRSFSNNRQTWLSLK